MHEERRSLAVWTLHGRLTGSACCLLLALVVACAEDELPTSSGGQIVSPVERATSNRTGSGLSSSAGPLERVELGPVRNPGLSSGNQSGAGSSVQLGDIDAGYGAIIEAPFAWKARSPSSFFREFAPADHVVHLIPQDVLIRAKRAVVDETGKATIPQVTPGRYHVVYKLNYNGGNSAASPARLIAVQNLELHDHGANVIAYWCRPPMDVRLGDPIKLDPLDLFWDNDASPGIAVGSNPQPDVHGVFRSDVDRFTFRALVSGNRKFTYSVIVAVNGYPMRTLWASPWTRQASDGVVTIPWNGYVMRSGAITDFIRKDILPQTSGAYHLATGIYMYAIQFREDRVIDAATGLRIPELYSLFAPDIGSLVQDEGRRQGELFEDHEFGQTLFCQFSLDPATESAAPVLSASPTPSPSPSVTS